MRKSITDPLTISLIFSGVSGVSEPIFEKRSTIFIRWLKSLFILFDGTLIDGLRAQVFDPSQQRGGGVPSWCAVSLASPIHTRFCSSCLVEAESDETQQDEDRNDGELDVGNQ